MCSDPVYGGVMTPKQQTVFLALLDILENFVTFDRSRITPESTMIEEVLVDEIDAPAVLRQINQRFGLVPVMTYEDFALMRTMRDLVEKILSIQDYMP